MADDKPERSWALTMNFKVKYDGEKREMGAMDTTWTLAYDTPCKTCGTVTRRMAPGTKHTIEASCSEACDPPIVAMDGLDDITKEK